MIRVPHVLTLALCKPHAGEHPTEGQVHESGGVGGGRARASNSSSPHQNIVVRHDVGQRTRPIGFISQYDLILIVEGHVSLALLVEDV